MSIDASTLLSINPELIEWIDFEFFLLYNNGLLPHMPSSEPAIKITSIYRPLLGYETKQNFSKKILINPLGYLNDKSLSRVYYWVCFQQ